MIDESGALALRPVSGGVVDGLRKAPHEVLRDAWVLAQLSEHTRLAYERDVNQFFTWCGWQPLEPLRAVRVHIDGYREHLAHGEHSTRYASRTTYSAATVARKLTAVSSFYSYAALEAPRLVASNPARDVKRPDVGDESTTVGLDVDEVRRVFSAAEALGPLEHAVTRTLASTGLRVSELCRADTADLGRERNQRTITVLRKGGKRQKLPLPALAAAVLDDYVGGRRGAVFVDRHGRRLTRQKVTYLLVRVTEAAGVAKRITPHSLRHTAATLALDAGETLRDVQILLGHKDPRTTNRYDRARHNLDRSAVHGLERYITLDREE